jgi:hypothetical protein
MELVKVGSYDFPHLWVQPLVDIEFDMLGINYWKYFSKW